MARSLHAGLSVGRGSRTTNRAPPCTDDETSTEPPWARAISATMASPSPLPPSSRARASSSRTKRSKIRVRWSSGTPGPSSSTTSSTWSPVSRTVIRTSECGMPRGVVDEVAHHLRERRLVAAHAAAAHSRHVDGEPRATQPHCLGEGEVVEVHVARVARDRRPRRRG